MNVLIVNDDGVDCPLFWSLLRECKKQAWIKNLSAVVPAFEKSWIAGAITRDAEISVSEKVLEGTQVFVVDGTPADCVSIALSGLPINYPDLIISGLNAGMNSGVAFSHSSGTLNGAKFGALHGIPSIAFSLFVDADIKNAWNVRDFEVLSSFEEKFNNINRYLLKAARAIINSGSILGESAVAHYCSFNSPAKFDPDLEPVLTTPSNNRFLPLYQEVSPNQWKHKFSGFVENFKESLEYKPTLSSDMELLFAGRVVYSLFRLDYDYGNLNLPLSVAGRVSESWSAL